MHPDAGDHLEQVEDHVALAERVPEHRDRADLERRRAEPDEVGVDAVELGEAHAHPLRLLGCLEREELLDREHEDELVGLEREVVDPLGVRDRLPVRLVLHRLLEAGMEVADHRANPCDVLTVEIDDQAKHAVRRGVVRAEVDGEDVVERVLLGVDLEDRRAWRWNPRAFVDARRRENGHRSYSSPEKRTGSPPIG